MIENGNYTVGDSYFLLSYVDKGFAYPVITTLVFLGVNIEGDSGLDEDLWFFQDAESYVKLGPYTGYIEEETTQQDVVPKCQGQVYDFPEKQLPHVLTHQELINDLSNDLEKRQRR